jgi:hypothetical protein
MEMQIKKIVVYKWFWSFEKEEAWLEEQSRQGWFLENVSSLCGYTLIKGDPQKRIYKIDFRDFSSTQDREEYLSLFADSGWQCAAANRSSYSYYFYTTADGSKRDIFSDNVSRAQRYRRYARYMALSIVPAFTPLLVLYLTRSLDPGVVGYQTPGLWEMSGSEFVSHFLFETPFVALRAAGYTLPLLVMALCLFFYLRYQRLYRKTLAG